MIPASASGVSITRSAPNSSYRPLVARKTPPNLPTSSPRTTTFGSRRISVLSASRTASMMFITGIGRRSSVPVGRLGAVLAEQPVPLLAQVPRHLLVDLFEHRLERRRTELVGAGERLADLGVVLLDDRALELLAPQADLLEVAAEAVERILALPRLGRGG